MQQTEQYQFNLIEGSDSFLPEPLNQNMEKVEAALEGRTRIQCYPYVGTGTTSRTFTFDQPPMAIILCAPYADTGHVILERGSVQYYPTGSPGYTNYVGKVNWQGNSVQLSPYSSSTTDPGVMFNTKNYQYLLIALFGGERNDFMT